jgi:hypothetical protein
VSEKAKRSNRVESVEETESIGDREVAYTRCFNAKGHSYTHYGSGPSYLCRRNSDGHRSVSFDYRMTIIESQLSRRTARRNMGAKGELETYYLERAVAFWHKKLKNDPLQQVVGDSGIWRRVLREMVVRAVRGLDAGPIEQLRDAVTAVRLVQSRNEDNELVMLAILAACRAHGGVPYRSEVLAVLGEDVRISRSASAFNQRLAGIGFAWLPAGRPRKPAVRVSKIHGRAEV